MTVGSYCEPTYSVAYRNGATCMHSATYPTAITLVQHCAQYGRAVIYARAHLTESWEGGKEEEEEAEKGF